MGGFYSVFVFAFYSQGFLLSMCPVICRLPPVILIWTLKLSKNLTVLYFDCFSSNTNAYKYTKAQVRNQFHLPKITCMRYSAAPGNKFNILYFTLRDYLFIFLMFRTCYGICFLIKQKKNHNCSLGVEERAQCLTVFRYGTGQTR